MLTAVGPDLNVIETDFDDYLQKPVDGETLLSTLAQHLDARDTDDRLDDFDTVVETYRAIERGD